jgi:hypothetical protein
MTCASLSEALRVKSDKEWFLTNQSRPSVQDPTTPDARVPITISVDRYVESLTRSKRTKNAYEHAFRECAEWNGSLKNGSKTFIEEIDKAHMAKFSDYLVDDEPENCPALSTSAEFWTTAGWTFAASSGPRRRIAWCMMQVLKLFPYGRRYGRDLR